MLRDMDYIIMIIDYVIVYIYVHLYTFMRDTLEFLFGWAFYSPDS